MTTPTISRVEMEGGQPLEVSDTTTLTQPLSDEQIRERILEVLSGSEREYAIDLVTALQLKRRIAEDTGERLTLDQFAEVGGWADDLERLRSE